MAKLIVSGVGLDENLLRNEFSSAKKIFTRSSAAARWLNTGGIKAVILLRPSESASDDSEDRVKEMLTEINANTDQGETMAYISPVSPIAMDKVAAALIAAHQKSETSIYPGVDHVVTMMQTLGEANHAALQIMDGLSLLGLDHFPLLASQPVLIYLPNDGLNSIQLSQLLRTVYSPDFGLYLLFDKANGEVSWKSKCLRELSEISTPLTAMYLPALSPEASLESFMQVIARLRSPEGCPWDRKQTHTSLRPYLLEETYEALSALDDNDSAGLKEELGDILLQIALHAQIGYENGEFTITDIIEGINRKIIYRHPHVFGTVSVENEKDVLQNWEKLKENEKEANGKGEQNGLLAGVPAILPALTQAQTIQERAARVGFDWPNIAPVLEKVLEELDEVKTAVNTEERTLELGDLLFAVVNYVRWHNVDAESALRLTILKFRKRFSYIEEKAKSAGQDIQKMTLQEMDALWEEAKHLD